LNKEKCACISFAELGFIKSDFSSIFTNLSILNSRFGYKHMHALR
jgi:hypothetical protein